MHTVKVLGDYIGGKFRRPRGAQSKIISKDPGDTGYRIGTFSVYPGHVDAAIDAARSASADWRRLDLGERADILRKFAAEVVNQRDVLTKVISAESGKPLWEAELDVSIIEAQVETDIREGVRATSPFKVGEIRWGVYGSCAFRPLGIAAVLGPAASPMDLPVSLILPTLLAGNTVVFKPSKLAPACGQLIAKLMDEVELPPGVFNMIQGDADIGLNLASHPAVDSVLFAGAVHSGRRVLEATSEQPHKLVSVQMGGVNPSLVLEDADMDRSVYECMKGSFMTSGQRYTSTGVILVARQRFEEFAELFLQKVGNLKVGYCDEPGVFMGPVLSKAAMDRALDRQQQLLGLGAVRMHLAQELDLKKPGYYLSPSVLAMKRPLPLDELRPSGQSFGPDVLLIPFKGRDEALRLANSTPYRLAASVMTEDSKRFLTYCHELNFGLVNHNLSTTETSMRLPLGGQGLSGNHRPMGVFNQRNSTYPVASLRAPQPFDQDRVIPPYKDM